MTLISVIQGWTNSGLLIPIIMLMQFAAAYFEGFLKNKPIRFSELFFEFDHWLGAFLIAFAVNLAASAIFLMHWWIGIPWLGSMILIVWLGLKATKKQLSLPKEILNEKRPEVVSVDTEIKKESEKHCDEWKNYWKEKEDYWAWKRVQDQQILEQSSRPSKEDVQLGILKDISDNMREMKNVAISDHLVQMYNQSPNEITIDIEKMENGKLKRRRETRTYH